MMSNDIKAMQEALRQIARIASKAAQQLDHSHDFDSQPPAALDMPGCTIKSLPKRLQIKAANTATKINPVNTIARSPIGAAAAMGILDPLQIAVLTTKYWGPTPRVLSVSFMEQTSQDLRRRILQHMNAWSEVACISFRETQQVGEIRISFARVGYWSYVGTDVLLVPANRPTMNLEGFSLSTPESEYRRVVRHETGHTLGFPHEHMREDLVARIDPEKAYQYFAATQGWNREMVNAQVLTSLDEVSLLGTPVDQNSIMCYQLPGSITKDNQPIAGGLDINQTDRAFAAQIYPKSSQAVERPRYKTSSPAYSDDWDEYEDVDPSV